MIRLFDSAIEFVTFRLCKLDEQVSADQRFGSGKLPVNFRPLAFKAAKELIESIEQIPSKFF